MLWDAVPSYLRKLDATCRQRLGPDLGLPLFDDASSAAADDAAAPGGAAARALLGFGSWMGGDRDGNPNVTPAVTAEVSTRLRLRAANLLLEETAEVYAELAISRGFSPALRGLAAAVHNSDDEREVGGVRAGGVVRVRACSCGGVARKDAAAGNTAKPRDAWRICIGSTSKEITGLRTKSSFLMEE